MTDCDAKPMLIGTIMEYNMVKTKAVVLDRITIVLILYTLVILGFVSQHV